MLFRPQSLSVSQSNRGCRGFFTAEVAAGLVLALTLMMLLSSVIVRERTQEKELARIRAQVRDLEAAMLTLQAGQPISQHIQIENLADPAPKGYSWVRLTAAATGAPGRPAARMPLVGLVPASRGAP